MLTSMADHKQQQQSAVLALQTAVLGGYCGAETRQLATLARVCAPLHATASAGIRSISSTLKKESTARSVGQFVRCHGKHLRGCA